MHYFVASTLLISGMIHLLPSIGVLGVARLELLYGVAVAQQDLEILLRHRAVLFAILGAFLVAAAFSPPLRWAAFAAGLVSVLSFIVLAWSVGGYNAHLSRVVTADVLAFVLLVCGSAAHFSTMDPAIASRG
jgi:hypothetical protein